jgi:hypothetical protein
MKCVQICTTKLPGAYSPTPSPLTDEAESQLIVEACMAFHRPKVLEIGTQYGDTTANMAKVVSVLKGEIVTIDVVTPPSTLPHIQRNDCRPKQEIGSHIPAKYRPFVHQILIDPTDPDALYNALKGRVFDLVFIDGDHSYEGVKHDVATIERLGIEPSMLFHDVWWDMNPAPVDGPLRVLQDFGDGCVLNMTHLGCRMNDVELLYGSRR